MRFSVSLAALAATLIVATPAAAQQATVKATPNPIAKGVVVLPLTLTKSQDLDFGTVIASTTQAGTVSIDANDGSRGVTGGVVGVPNYPGDRALFQGAGTPDQKVLVTLQAPTVLVNGSNSINVVSMGFDAAASSAPNATTGYLETTRVINSTGAFEIGVGGTFAIAAGQANGTYSAPFIVTAEYQ
ncbi:MAG: DUF4402 domain-containing protein [Sphingomicrobium sp.]|jgi:hypothetical protein